MSKQYILRFSCKDAYGIIAKITGFLSEHHTFIRELSEFGDPFTKKFFFRCLIEFSENSPSIDQLAEGFSKIGTHFQADWEFIDASYKPNVLILVSKFSHCLNDLLYRYETGSLKIHLPAILSNHPDLEGMARRVNVPFFHYPCSKENKEEQENAIYSFIEEKKINLVILARYMQILSPAFSKKMEGKIINIHHSFLPSFKGAKPYHQAFERGVKIIGATAHYVTDALDEGPIIEQEVMRVDHTRTPEELMSIGYDIESQVLARAVKYHIENRIFVNGNKTIIFK